MTRFLFLAVIPLFVGFHSATAGIIVGSESEIQISASMEIPLESKDPCQPLSLQQDRDLATDLAGSALSPVTGGASVAIPPGSQRCKIEPALSGRALIANLFLPPSPDLDGLLKPPQHEDSFFD